MSFKIPEGAVNIIKGLNAYRLEAYLVGGCVRDMIMGREPHDWDICTNATPDIVKEIFPVTIDTGLKHGTVTVMKEDGQYEVTTYRVDGKYSDGRRPDSVEFVGDLKEDLARRDFTMNAIAYDITKGSFIDPFHGTSDIISKTIRCVGDPYKRFEEDKLRILRAIRFSCQLNFKVEEKTKRAMSNFSLNEISKERIFSEFIKIMKSDHGSKFFRYPTVLFDCFPEFRTTYKFDQKNRYHCYNLYNHIGFAYINACNLRVDLITRMAVFFHDIAKPECQTIGEDGEAHYIGHPQRGSDITREILTRLRCDTETMEKVCELVYYHDATIAETKPGVRRWLNKIGEKQFRRLLVLKSCDISAQVIEYYDVRKEHLDKVRAILEEILAENDCISLKSLAVNGKDIMSLGVPEGKMIGEILTTLLDMVIEAPEINTKTGLLAIAKTYWEVKNRGAN